ncbi:MAG: hypothetical protein P1P84_22345 [Deferrisomatales bacterium]|nr:hypothetical protein [Deferrisomatales bacterium]
MTVVAHKARVLYDRMKDQPALAGAGGGPGEAAAPPPPGST